MGGAGRGKTRQGGGVREGGGGGRKNRGGGWRSPRRAGVGGGEGRRREAHPRGRECQAVPAGAWSAGQSGKGKGSQATLTAVRGREVVACVERGGKRGGPTEEGDRRPRGGVRGRDGAERGGAARSVGVLCCAAVASSRARGCRCPPQTTTPPPSHTVAVGRAATTTGRGGGEGRPAAHARGGWRPRAAPPPQGAPSGATATTIVAEWPRRLPLLPLPPETRPR